MGTGRALLSLCFIFFLWRPALNGDSRFTLSPYVEYGYSDNIFWDMSRVGDAILSPGLGIDLSTNSWSLFLNADGRIYRSNDYLNSTLISGGASFFKVFSSRTSLFVSPEFSWVRYSDSVSFLNTAAPSITVGLKHALSAQVSGRLGAGLHYSDYLNEDSYDRYRLTAFMEMSAFFKTQSTIRLTLGMNYQFFPHIAVPMPTTATTPASLAAAAVSGSGAGSPHKRNTPSPEPPDQPEPPDAPPSDPGTSPPPAEPQMDGGPSVIGLTIPQPYVTLRIAQGIGFKTGIVAEFMFRKSQAPLEGIQSIAASEWALEQTDENFFWQGTRLSLGFKTEALLDLEIALDLSLFKKVYPGIEALDLEGVPVQPLADRSDAMAQVNARLAKKLGSLSLYVSANYRRNKSNDLYFLYDFFTISAGMDLAI